MIKTATIRSKMMLGSLGFIVEGIRYMVNGKWLLFDPSFHISYYSNEDNENDNIIDYFFFIDREDGHGKMLLVVIGHWPDNMNGLFFTFEKENYANNDQDNYDSNNSNGSAFRHTKNFAGVGIFGGQIVCRIRR